MPLHHAQFELSDEEHSQTPAESQTCGSDRKARRRSTRACDQCRRTKSKCERDAYASARQPCYGCSSLGLRCTFAGPSHKRGPPKGYILAIERRLHQVEALLGTIIASDDPRARGLLADLSKDQLAGQIIRRVDTGPFGPKGRGGHPFGSTKEDFLTSIMAGVGEGPSSDPSALVSPGCSWQDGLQSLLSTPFPEMAESHGVSNVDIPGMMALSDARSRRASFPMAPNEAQLPHKDRSLSPASSLAHSFGDGTDMSSSSMDSLGSFGSQGVKNEVLDPNAQSTVNNAFYASGAQVPVFNRVSAFQVFQQYQTAVTGGSVHDPQSAWALVSPS